MSSTSEIATCATSSARLSHERPRVTLRPVSFIDDARSTRVARSAGIKPKTTPVSALRPVTNPATRQSIGTSAPNGRSCLLQ